MMKNIDLSNKIKQTNNNTETRSADGKRVTPPPRIIKK